LSRGGKGGKKGEKKKKKKPKTLSGVLKGGRGVKWGNGKS